MAEKTCSVAEARRNLARLIRSAERGQAIEITRRGEPVAVLLSAADYVALTGDRPPFLEALARVRERFEVDGLGIGDAEFEGLRYASPGREVAL